jgi:endoribonuclease Dicer
MLVMTPAILNHLLADDVITFKSICLLIFDEAHHCSKRHPYAEIMQKYHALIDPSERPKIFGMTASPCNTKAGSRGKMQASLMELEALMDAKLETASTTDVRAHHMLA